MFFLMNLVLQKQNFIIKCKTLSEQPLCFSTARLARMLHLWLSYALGIHRSTSHDKLHHLSGSSFCITSLRDGKSSHVHLTTRSSGNDKPWAVTAFHQPQTSAGFHPRALGECCSLQREPTSMSLQAPFPVLGQLLPRPSVFYTDISLFFYLF